MVAISLQYKRVSLSVEATKTILEREVGEHPEGFLLSRNKAAPDDWYVAVFSKGYTEAMQHAAGFKAPSKGFMTGTHRNAFQFTAGPSAENFWDYFKLDEDLKKAKYLLSKEPIEFNGGLIKCYLIITSKLID